MCQVPGDFLQAAGTVSIAGDLEESAEQVAVDVKSVLGLPGAEELPEEECAADREGDVVRIGDDPGASGPIVTEARVRAQDIDVAIKTGEKIRALLAAEAIVGVLIGLAPFLNLIVDVDKLGNGVAGFCVRVGGRP